MALYEIKDTTHVTVLALRHQLEADYHRGRLAVCFAAKAHQHESLGVIVELGAVPATPPLYVVSP